MRPARGIGWLTIGIVVLSGCGKAPEERFVPVRGQVTYQGQPLKTGVVIFIADGGKGNMTKHEPHGSIGSAGGYEMTTAGKPGAPTGWYKVKIVANAPQDPKNPYALPASLIPKKFGDVATSDLSVEVTEQSGEKEHDFSLK